MTRLFALVAALTLSTVAHADTFTLTSPDLKDGATLPKAQVFSGMGCTGDNKSPALAWKGAPVGTKSYGVTVYDPDAPTGSGWWHWLVYNIPSSATALPAGAGDSKKPSLPMGAMQGRTDFGGIGFGGACPPPGDKPHRYIFTVFALKTAKIEVPPDASAAMIGYFLNASKLATATFTAKYGR